MLGGPPTKADRWEQLVASGLGHDAATAQVNQEWTQRANLWEHFHQQGMAPDDATVAVNRNYDTARSVFAPQDFSGAEQSAIAVAPPSLDVSRLPTIPERLRAETTAGQPRRLGSPTGEPTVMSQDAAHALEEQQPRSLTGIVGHAIRSNPVLKGSVGAVRDIYHAIAPVIAPSEDEAQSVRDAAAAQAAKEAAYNQANPPGMARNLTEGAVRYGLPFTVGAGAGRALAGAAELGPGVLGGIGKLALAAHEAGSGMAGVTAMQAATEGRLPTLPEVGSAYKGGLKWGLVAAPGIVGRLVGASRAARLAEAIRPPETPPPAAPAAPVVPEPPAPVAAPEAVAPEVDIREAMRAFEKKPTPENRQALARAVEAQNAAVAARQAAAPASVAPIAPVPAPRPAPEPTLAAPKAPEPVVPAPPKSSEPTINVEAVARRWVDANTPGVGDPLDVAYLSSEINRMPTEVRTAIRQRAGEIAKEPRQSLPPKPPEGPAPDVSESYLRTRAQEADAKADLPDATIAYTELAKRGDPEAQAWLAKDHDAEYALRQAKMALPASEEAAAPSAPVAAFPNGTPHYPAGWTGRLATSAIGNDPARFQFKSLGESGVSNKLKAVQTWNDDFAGLSSLWQDPATGKVWVINGHHRLELAQRLGQPDMPVRFIDAPDAESARAHGALINIAEGHGTATDVAKFLRDSGQTREDLGKYGVSLREDLARSGVALANLAPDVFEQVATGKVPQSWGVALGTELADSPDLQRVALKAVTDAGGRYSETEVAEVAKQVRAAGTETGTQETLFGTEATNTSLYVPRAQVVAALQKRLGADQRLFDYVSQGNRARELGRAGTTQIDVGAARGLSEEARRLGGVFDTLYNRSGPIADLVNEAARRVARGEKPGVVAADIYPAIGDAVRAELESGGLGAGAAGRGATPPSAEGPPVVAPPAAATAEAPVGSTEAGAPHNQTTVQPGLFGGADLIGKPQGELLPETAGIPTASLQEGKIQPAEAARLASEQGRTEPPGTAPGELFGTEETNPDLASELQRASALYQRSLPFEHGKALTATIANIRASVDRFVERGVSPDNPHLQALTRLADDAERHAPVGPGPEAGEPERIRAAAIKTKAGVVYEGPIHVDAMLRAQDASPDGLVDVGETGYVTSRGRFVDAEEATAIAQAAEQVAPRLWGGRKKVVAQDFGPGGVPGEATAAAIRNEQTGLETRSRDDVENLLINGSAQERALALEELRQRGPRPPEEAPPPETTPETAATEIAASPTMSGYAERSGQPPRWLPSQGTNGVDLRLEDDLALRRMSQQLDAALKVPGEVPPILYEDRAALDAELADRGTARGAPVSQEPPKSPGHVAFFTNPDGVQFELYKDAKGDLFRANVSDVQDVRTGYRIGRWEAPAHMADAQVARILGEAATPEPPTSALTPELARELLALPGPDQAHPTGPSNADLRARILSQLTGQMVPKAKAGATAVRDALLEAFGITKEGKAPVQYERELRAKLRELAGGSPAGAVHPAVLGALGGGVAGGAVGAVAGAKADTEHPVRGALIGAGLGALGGGLLGAAAMGPRKVPVAGETPPVTELPPEASPEAIAAVETLKKPAEGGMVNLARYNLDPQGVQLLRDATARAAARYGLSPKSRISNVAQRELARQLYRGDADKMLALQQRWGAAELIGARDANAEIIARQQEIAPRLLSDATPAAEKATLSAEWDALDKQQQGILGRGMGDMTEAARAVSSGQAMAEAATDPYFWMLKAARKLSGNAAEGAKILPDDIKERLLKKLETGGPEAAADYVSKISSGTLGSFLLKTFVVNVISSPAIYGKAIVSGLTHNLLRMSENAVATVGDALWSGATGATRTHSAFNVDMLRAAGRGFVQGVKNARDVARNTDLTDPYSAIVQKAMMRSGHEPVQYDSPLVAAYDRVVNDTVLRTHGAYFALTSRIGFELSIAEQARVMALNEGLKGAKFTARVAALRATPTNEMFARAVDAGKEASFTNKGVLASVGGAMRREAVKAGFWPGAAATAMMPVVRIAGNVAEQALQRTPLGFGSALVSASKLAARMLKKVPAAELEPLQRKLLTSLSRASVGSVGQVALGYELAKWGYLTGVGPDKPSERQVLLGQGWQPSSIRFSKKGTWNQIGAISPVGMTLTIGATLYEMAHEGMTGTPLEQRLQQGAAMAKVIAQNPLFTGPQSFSAALASPTQAGARAGEQVAIGAIPLSGLLRRLSQSLDPTVRQPQGLGEAIQAITPGMSSSVPAQVDWRGNEVKRAGGLEHLLYFGNPRLSKDDPDAAELIRVGVGVPRVAQRTFIVDGKRQTEPEEDFIARRKSVGFATGMLVHRTITDPDYLQLPAQVAAEWQSDPDLRKAYPDVATATKEIQGNVLREAIRRARAFFPRYPE
jgi:hypothetical protein